MCFIVNKDQIKIEYADFKYAILNPQNLLGIDDFNQAFFDKIDQIEIDIKLLKNAYNNDQMTNLLEEGNEGGTIINYPPKWRFELKSPSSLD